MSEQQKHAGEQGKLNMQPVYYVQAPIDNDEDEINLLDYWRVLMQFKWLIVGISFFTTVIAIVAALVATEIYQAEVTIAPADEESGGGISGLAGQFGGLAALAGVNIGGGGGKSEEAIAILGSRQFTLEFIHENKLMPVLFEDAWDEQAKKWKVENEEDVPTDWDAYKVFDKVRTVSNDAKTGMTTVAIEWKDPELAAQWANKLIVKLNENRKKRAIDEAEKSIRYLENQLRETSVVEMRQALFQLIEAQSKNRMLANVRDEFAFKVIDPAVVPEERVKPKRKLMVVLGGMVGVMLGVFLAFFISFIRNQKEQAAEAK
ncbi:MAG: Wzz/FepE/Etk N-terminal domain-containing protein [Gammaproteobacteria bacterium]|nr:Wzz/FepE/Etk N-terminal domain-containing protein [Gammaproteobacteria bacterium]